MAVSTMLNMRTNELVKGTAEWLVACQTFEGGMAASPNAAEAHGGYAFCVLAALCCIYPPTELPRLLNMDNFIVILCLLAKLNFSAGLHCNKLLKEASQDVPTNWWMPVTPGGWVDVGPSSKLHATDLTPQTLYGIEVRIPISSPKFTKLIQMP